MTYALGERKYSYFLITMIVSGIIISVPLISNHFLNPEHYLHIAIHEVGFMLAIFLTAVTVISYFKTKITRMIFSSYAFGILAFGQGVYLYSEITIIVKNISYGQDVFDVCILIMTVLFAIGIFYKR